MIISDKQIITLLDLITNLASCSYYNHSQLQNEAFRMVKLIKCQQSDKRIEVKDELFHERRAMCDC